MRNKGQLGLGPVLIAFIGIIIAVMLYQAIGPYIGDGIGANRGYNRNVSFAAPATGASVDLTGQELLGTPLVVNGSSGTILTTTNYTITEGVKTTGIKGVRYTSVGSQFPGQTVNVSYEYYPDGYIDDAGGRSVANLIPLFAALAIAVIALVPTVRNGIMDLVKN